MSIVSFILALFGIALLAIIVLYTCAWITVDVLSCWSFIWPMIVIFFVSLIIASIINGIWEEKFFKKHGVDVQEYKSYEHFYKIFGWICIPSCIIFGVIFVIRSVLF